MQPTCMCTGVSSWPPQRRHGCRSMETPESRSFQMRSLRCTGVWPLLARGDVPSVDAGRGVRRAQGRVSLVRKRMVQLRSLWDRAELLHGGRLQVEVAVMTGDDEWAWLGPGGFFCRTTSRDAAQSALCSSASLWWEVARANQNGCPMWCLRSRGLS